MPATLYDVVLLKDVAVALAGSSGTRANPYEVRPYAVVKNSLQLPELQKLIQFMQPFKFQYIQRRQIIKARQQQQELPEHQKTPWGVVVRHPQPCHLSITLEDARIFAKAANALIHHWRGYAAGPVAARARERGAAQYEFGNVDRTTKDRLTQAMDVLKACLVICSKREVLTEDDRRFIEEMARGIMPVPVVAQLVH